MAKALTPCPKNQLNLRLTPEQLAELEPIIQNGGKVVFTSGEVKGNNFSLSYVACNAPFVRIQDDRENKPGGRGVGKLT
jgi:hypothetical protein